MAANPVYFATPFFGHGVVSAANANLDGTGSLVTLVTAIASEGKIELIRAHARVTTTPGMVRIFLFDGTATYRLLAELPIPANTVSASNPAAQVELDLSQQLKFIPSGWSLVASTHNAEAINVEVWGSRI
jgi:hypothetical protein